MMWFSCFRPLIKVHIPFSQCGHFIQVEQPKKLCFFVLYTNKKLYAYLTLIYMKISYVPMYRVSMDLIHGLK
jgi:hypothetical protein